MLGGLGTTEILIIAAVLILLFGAKKLPDLARGSGRALRIFKSETKGLMSEDDTTDPHGRPLPPGTAAQQQGTQQGTQQPAPRAEPVAQPVQDPMANPGPLPGHHDPQR